MAGHHRATSEDFHAATRALDRVVPWNFHCVAFR